MIKSEGESGVEGRVRWRVSESVRGRVIEGEGESAVESE